ncbi:MAG: amidohydrolase family protein [Acidimicrobiales bacterium]
MARLLFHGGQVFDATGDEPEPPKPADIVVDDGRIVSVGPGLDGDEAIDCAGKTLVPGLFDCHTHVMVSHFDMWKMAQTPFSLQFFEAARNLEATLAAGITTVRDAGGADLGVKTAVERGLVNGPRMQISISMISQTGGHGDKWMVCGGDFPTPFGAGHPGKPTGLADGPLEVRKKVRELIRAGADVIKVATSGGVLSPRDDPRHGHFRDDELTALVTEAAAMGRWVMAHSQATDGIKASIRAGIRSIEHGIYLDDEAIEMMIDRGTYLVPTLMAPRGVLELAASGANIADESLRKAEMVVDIHTESISRAMAAGVKVAMGTDSGVTPHGQNLRELALMVDGGMTPVQALVATSRTAAELLGVDGELGTLEPGKRADIVVVDGDAMEVAKLADRIEAVWKDGELVVDASGERQVIGHLPERQPDGARRRPMTAI